MASKSKKRRAFTSMQTGTPNTSKQTPATTKPKNTARKLLDFVEQPLFLAPVGILGGLVGLFFYLPVLIVCGACILFAFHRARVVEGRSMYVQVSVYSLLFVMTTASLYSLGILIKRNMPHNITASEIALELKQMLQSNPPPGSSSQKIDNIPPSSLVDSSGTEVPFYATVEVRVVSPGSGLMSGFWLMYTGQHGSTLSPIDTLLFVRITNLKPIKIIVTAYSVDVKDKGKWRRLTTMDTRIGYILFIRKNDGTGNIPAVGRTINIPAEGKSTYLVGFAPSEADYKHAAVMQALTLDSQLGDKYLAPHESARGWTIFESDIPVGTADLRINLTDELGNTYHYIYSATKDKRDDSDIMPHLMTIAQIIDASSFHRQPYFTKKQ